MGAEAIKQRGTFGSTGTKLFSISGDVEKPGVYEFDMGIKVNDLLKIVGAEDAKAVQVGGASGINVARKDFDKPISYEGLPPGGSIIVFGPDRDMLKVLKNFMEFFTEESCGQCTPCREGCGWIDDIIKRILDGKGTVSDLTTILDVCETMNGKTVCVFAPAVKDIIKSLVEKYRDEFVSYIENTNEEQGDAING